MFKRKTKITRQAGFMLLEATLALLLASVAGAYALNKQMDELKDIKIKAQADAMVVLQSATNAYINKYFQSLTHNGAGYAGSISFTAGGHTVADMYNPTIADLSALDVGMPPNYSPAALIGGNYKIHLTLSGSCNATSCPISGLVWIDQPLMDGAQIDYSRLGLAMQQIGADAAFSSNLDTAGNSTGTAANQIHGYRSSWVDNNPQMAGGVGVPGIMAIRTGASGMLSTQYLRIDGSNQMTGNLQVGDGTTNHDIVNLRDIVNARDISNSGNVYTQGNIYAGNNMMAIGDISTPNGNISTQNGNIQSLNGTVEGNIVMATGGGGGNGQTILQNYGMLNSTGNINILPKDNGQVIMRPSSGARNGALVTDFNETVIGNHVTISQNDATIQNPGMQNIQAGTNLYLNPYGGGPVVVGGKGGASGLWTYGTATTASSAGFGLQSVDGAGGANSAPQSPVGSLYVNDIYLRSISKWATQLGSNGSYLMYANGPYTAMTPFMVNTSASTWAVTVSGGAGSCGNGFDITGYVNGGTVAFAKDNNPDWAKVGSITFFVPSGAYFYAQSFPYNCGIGQMFMTIYQM
jgi:hypothetical protein